MLSLTKGALSPSTGLQDKYMFMTSIIYDHAIHPDNNSNNGVVLETIFNLVSSSKTRNIGLQLLEIALQQNFTQFYLKGRWPSLIFGVIRDTHTSTLEKTQACKVLALVVPNMPDDSAISETSKVKTSKDELIKEIFPLLLEKIQENVEWAEEACICVKLCLKTFPKELSFYEHSLLQVILHQASNTVSSKFIEVLAECFCELPYCTKDNSVSSIQTRWNDIYKQTLKTIESLQITCLKHRRLGDPYDRAENEAEEFEFSEKNPKSIFYQDFCQDVRRFVNLCKCLAKLLSIQSKYSVKIPIRSTIHCLLPLYMGNKKDKLVGSNEEILYTFIIHMQLAGLAVFEALIKNCNVQKNSIVIRDLIIVTLESGILASSSQILCELRVATWKLLSVWLDGYGRNVSKRIAEKPIIVQELLKDIQIDTCESQQINNGVQTSSKSKKTTGIDAGRKSLLMKKNKQKICVEALNTFESLLCIGTLDLSKGMFQEICNAVFNICHTLSSTCNPFPYPYNDESCREKLYMLVQTIELVINPGEVQVLQTALKILSHINRDPSFKIRKLSNRASVINRLLLYPKRPLPVSSDNKLRCPNVSNETKFNEWSSEEYVPNLHEENVSDTIENVKVESSFQIKSDVEVHSDEYMDVESHYSEQVVENQCNGEDMIQLESTSQLQDDEESEEEEEEEEEERSYIEEEMNQEEAEHDMYIPSSSKVSISTPIQINSETVESINEPEYEELAPCIKTEENSFNNSTEKKCINGEEEIIHEKDMGSSSVQQVVTNENGIFGIEEDNEDDEENEDEEEEENESCSAEKRESPGAEKSGPPPKKQKIETTDDPEVNEMQERPQSPSMEAMKAALIEILPTEEEVRSGKIQLSATSEL